MRANNHRLQTSRAAHGPGIWRLIKTLAAGILVEETLAGETMVLGYIIFTKHKAVS